MSVSDDADLLYGMPAIAAFLCMRTRQAYHLAEVQGLPIFKLGGKVCARRSTLNAWLAEREAAAMREAGGAGQPLPK